MVKKILESKLTITIVLLFCSSLLAFFGGFFSNDRPIESIAEYSAQVVLNNTSNKKYNALTVQATENSGSIADSYSEFNNLYGVFKQRKVTFASAMNMFNNETGEKDHEVIITKDSTPISKNLSLFYFGPGGSIEYNGHYKHYVYPIETMFADEAGKDELLPTKYVAYISQEHANNLLELYGEQRNPADGEFTIEQYEKLLKDSDKNIIDIAFDGEPHKFVILNIYLMTNYYFEGISEVLDDFIAVSYNVPLNLRNEQKNIYFFSEYSYQNKYFMEYVNDVYSNRQYKVEINHLNINGQIDDEYLLSFYYSNLNYDLIWLCAIFIVTAFILLAVGIFVSYRNRLFQQKRFLFLSLLTIFIPYICFFIIYVCSNSILFFSKTSGSFFFIIVLIWLLYLIVSKSFLGNKHLTNNMHGEVCYEIDI